VVGYSQLQEHQNEGQHNRNIAIHGWPGPRAKKDITQTCCAVVSRNLSKFLQPEQTLYIVLLGLRNVIWSELRPMLDGKLQELVDALELKFLAEVGAMSFDSAWADKKLTRNLLIGFVLGDQL